MLLVAGAAAGVAAIFKASATGAIFALEVPFQGDLARILLPSLVASASGYLVFTAINGTEPLFPILGSHGFVYRDQLGALLIGLLAGLGARCFAWMLRRAIPAFVVPGLIAAVVAELVMGESSVTSYQRNSPRLDPSPVRHQEDG